MHCNAMQRNVHGRWNRFVVIDVSKWIWYSVPALISSDLKNVQPNMREIYTQTNFLPLFVHSDTIFGKYLPQPMTLSDWCNAANGIILIGNPYN